MWWFVLKNLKLYFCNRFKTKLKDQLDLTKQTKKKQTTLNWTQTKLNYNQTKYKPNWTKSELKRIQTIPNWFWLNFS